MSSPGAIVRQPSSEVTTRPIAGGEVACPIRGVVDLERCFICPGFEGLHEGTRERLICRPERDVAGWAQADETWDID